MISTVVGVAVGFDSRMNRSKKEPVEPSARNQLVCGAVTPALSWPAAKTRPLTVMYIARSTRIGTPFVEMMVAETSVLCSVRSVAGRPVKPVSLSMLMVRRLRGPTV